MLSLLTMPRAYGRTSISKIQKSYLSNRNKTSAAAESSRNSIAYMRFSYLRLKSAVIDKRLNLHQKHLQVHWWA